MTICVLDLWLAEAFFSRNKKRQARRKKAEDCSSAFSGWYPPQVRCQTQFLLQRRHAGGASARAVVLTRITASASEQK